MVLLGAKFGPMTSGESSIPIPLVGSDERQKVDLQSRAQLNANFMKRSPVIAYMLSDLLYPR